MEMTNGHKFHEINKINISIFISVKNGMCPMMRHCFTAQTAVHNHVHPKIHTFDSARSVVNVHFATKRCQPQLRPCGGSPLSVAAFSPDDLMCLRNCFQSNKRNKRHLQSSLD